MGRGDHPTKFLPLQVHRSPTTHLQRCTLPLDLILFGKQSGMSTSSCSVSTIEAKGELSAIRGTVDCARNRTVVVIYLSTANNQQGNYCKYTNYIFAAWRIKPLHRSSPVLIVTSSTPVERNLLFALLLRLEESKR